jgi:hypothetical protein
MDGWSLLHIRKSCGCKLVKFVKHHLELLDGFNVSSISLVSSSLRVPTKRKEPLHFVHVAMALYTLIDYIVHYKRHYCPLEMYSLSLRHERVIIYTPRFQWLTSHQGFCVCIQNNLLWFDVL